MESVSSLFKYMPISIYTLKALSLDMIWYPTVDTLNDPYDCRAEIIGTLNRYLLKKESKKNGLKYDECQASEVIRRASKNLKKLDATIHTMGVLSLSESLTNPTMWSHYADSHKGICLELSRSEGDALFKEALQVKYSGYKIVEAKEFFKMGRQELLRLCVDIAKNKAVDWGYEKEWRHVITPGSRYLPFPGVLKSVTFGMNVDTIDAIVIYKIVIKNNPECIFRKALRKSGSYELDIVDELELEQAVSEFEKGSKESRPGAEYFKPSWVSA